MTRKWIAIFGVLLLAAQCTGESQAPKGEQQASKEVAIKSDKDKVSYGIGVSVAKNFKKQGIEVDLDLMVQGLKDEFSGAKLLVSDEEMNRALTAYQTELRQKAVEAKKSAAENNRKEGEAFLAENKKKEGVVTLPSGLQYKILQAGTGKKPQPEDMVEVHYRGTLINGAEFDSSHKAGKPGIFEVTGVIPGWQEALKLMPAGSKWQLFIPSNLAYGERGSGPLIGPNATLIFEVELLAVK